MLPVRVSGSERPSSGSPAAGGGGARAGPKSGARARPPAAAGAFSGGGGRGGRGGAAGGGPGAGGRERGGEAEAEAAAAPAGVDEHVLGLEVAVQHAGAVGRRQRATGLKEYGEDVLPAAGAGRQAMQPRAEVDAVDQLHGDEDLLVAVAVDANVVDQRDVLVAQAGHGLGLAQQPGAPGRVAGERRVQQLDRDLAPQALVDRRVDDAHGPLPPPLEHAVAADPDRRARTPEQLLGDAGVEPPRLDVALGARRLVPLLPARRSHRPAAP